MPNPINRYELSQRNRFNTNPDGSVELYLQAESPGKEKESNWLPAPKGKFALVLRIYSPGGPRLRSSTAAGRRRR